MAQVRYIVDDVETAAAFYTKHLGFSVRQKFPAIAILAKDDLTLWLAGPTASASRPMPDGAKPQPGGWNRFVVTVDDLEATVARLKAEGVQFRNDTVVGPGCRQILVLDPAGNVIELFQPG